MKAIMVMFDSLNRRLMEPYGCDWVHTPNFTRLAERSAAFEKAFIGSMPCMPARRELHTGRYNFLHRSWGPLEPFDDSMPQILDENGVHSHKVTDHQHYWEDGGATYHTRFTTHEFNQEVKRVLTDNGVYTINLVDAPNPGRFLRAFIHTLRNSFDYVGIVPVAVDLTFDDRTTVIVMATDNPILQPDLDAAHARLDHVDVKGYLIEPAELETWMNSRDTVLLTDNYAPVDNYLAPLYLKQSKN